MLDLFCVCILIFRLLFELVIVSGCVLLLRLLLIWILLWFYVVMVILFLMLLMFMWVFGVVGWVRFSGVLV